MVDGAVRAGLLAMAQAGLTAAKAFLDGEVWDVILVIVWIASVLLVGVDVMRPWDSYRDSDIMFPWIFFHSIASVCVFFPFSEKFSRSVFLGCVGGLFAAHLVWIWAAYRCCGCRKEGNEAKDDVMMGLQR